MYYASSTALTSEDVYLSRIKRKLSNNAVKLDNCKNSIIGFTDVCSFNINKFIGSDYNRYAGTNAIRLCITMIS